MLFLVHTSRQTFNLDVLAAFIYQRRQLKVAEIFELKVSLKNA